MNWSDPHFLLLLALAAGVICHWLKKRLRDGMPGNLLDYLKANPANTYAMATSVIGAWFAAILTGAFDAATPTFALASGWGIGWALDSGFNKGPGQ